MLTNYPSIAKTITLQLGSSTLPDEIIQIINDYLPSMVFCDECKCTLRYRAMLQNIKSPIIKETEFTKFIPIQCRQDHLVLCTQCHTTTLCPRHADIAKHYGNLYLDAANSSYMCDNCCWEWIG